jgi:hypothetical protein
MVYPLKGNFMSESQAKFDQSLKTMVKGLRKGRDGVQDHLIRMGILAAEHNNLEGYVKSTIDTLDEEGQHTFSKAAILWIEKFYGYTCDEEGKQVNWEGAEFIRENFQDAKDCKFWTMAPKKASSFKKWDFADVVNAAISEGDKKLKKVAEGKLAAELVVVDIEQMRRVKAALAA